MKNYYKVYTVYFRSVRYFRASASFSSTANVEYSTLQSIKCASLFYEIGYHDHIHCVWISYLNVFTFHSAKTIALKSRKK